MSLLAVEGLTVRARDETTLLDDVSLSIDAEETVLLAGPSGSGKTLLGKAIAGLLSPVSTVSVDGTVHREGTVGMCFQDPRTQLVRERVRSDVAFGLENRGVAPAEIHDRIDDWADRLDAVHLLDREITALSRGETTLVALLGTLVTEPDLVVLDEPLAALDARNRRLVLDAIEELHGETALFVAEHDAKPVLELADRAILLEEGEIGANGSPRAVVGSLHEAGIEVPFATAVALARGDPAESVPLSGG
ncbi:MAG: ABC transporter ATP-binding protein [Halodesulfurarchaeum sp.]|nr:ABC transporter ATP-binding protein [Halodesulfurarchaeum sp.]